MTVTPFAIVDVPAARGLLDEPMGTKRKFWFADGEVRWLFKFARQGTGEHWSEKIAAELGAVLGVPCARVELARSDRAEGSVSRSFLPPDGTLVHGNEILQETDTAYPGSQMRGVRKHTVSAVLSSLVNVKPPPDALRGTAIGCFVGYLMLDAIIGNGDRHHENWGVVQVYGPQPHRYLAPSYDHASSLGREISDEERMERLTGRDRRRTIDTYLRRARSAFYGSEAERKPLSPVGAFRFAADLYPEDAAFWLARARDLRQHVVEEIVQAVPTTAISDAARRFALAVVTWSRALLVGETP